MPENKDLHEAEAIKLLSDEVDALTAAKTELEAKVEELTNVNEALKLQLEKTPETIPAGVTTVKLGKSTYQLKYPFANIDGKKYTAEDISKDKDVAAHLKEIGFLTKA